MSIQQSGLDRRIRAILTRLAGTSGGEAVAALAALERLLPANVALADAIFVGLHHLRQDVGDPSLAAALRRLESQLSDQAKRQRVLERRIRLLESALGDALAELEAIAGGMR